MDAELEVQRTIKRAELTAFLCLFKRVIGPIKMHVDNKGIVGGLLERREKMHRSKSWRCLLDQDLGRIAPSSLKRNFGVEHVKAHPAPHTEGCEEDVAI